MAEGWIPACKNLTRKREILAIAKTTARSRHEVAGLMLEFWSWCDSETSDGRIVDVHVDALETMIGGDSRFWLAVQNAGWLTIDPDGMVIPNFSRWLGRSAKSRLGEAVRKRMQRESLKAASQVCPDKSGTTEQNRTEQNNKKCPLNPQTEKSTTTPQEFLDAWNMVPGLTAAKGLTGKRLRHFQARIRDAEWSETWRVAMRKASESAFCRGENDRGWRATVDWFLRPETVTRLLEGQYDDRPKKSRDSSERPKTPDELQRDAMKHRAEVEKTINQRGGPPLTLKGVDE